MSLSVPPLLIVLVAATAAPLVAHATRRIGVPVVVLEVLLGVAIGPQGLGWAASQGIVPQLATFGLAFLFFVAGMEIDLFAIRGRPLNLAIAAWSAGMAVACVVALGMAAAGWTHAWLVVAIALTTTALGVVVPVLRDSGALETPFGRYVVAMGVMGELGPILTMSLLLSTEHGTVVQIAFTGIFIAVVLVVAWLLARSLEAPDFLGLLRRSMTQSGQLPVRIAITILGALVVLADMLGLDLALGALAAGMVIALATRGLDNHVFHLKLDAISFGFFAPIFFINSGMNLDVAAAFGRVEGLVLAGAYLLALVIVRIPAILLYRGELGGRPAVALGLYSATSLGMVVALTQIGVKSGLMQEAEAASLIAGATLTMVLFPALAARLTGGRTGRGGGDIDRGGL